MSLLVEVVRVGNELVRVDDPVVVEEHSSDLTGSLAILSLNELVDSVTDFLAFLSGVHSCEALHIHRGEGLHSHLLLLE